VMGVGYGLGNVHPFGLIERDIVEACVARRSRTLACP
jgi:hypothetical protein